MQIKASTLIHLGLKHMKTILERTSNSICMQIKLYFTLDTEVQVYKTYKQGHAHTYTCT